MIKKIIAFLCALVMALSCFVSCKEKKSDTPVESEETVSVSELASYTIVYGKNCGSSVAKKANVLAAKIQSLYGVTLKAETDDKTDGGDKEILVGYTNRPQSREFLNDMRSRDYGYAMVDGKICIAGATDEFTLKAVDLFMQTTLEQAGEKWELGAPNLTRSEYAIDDMKINGESIKGWSVIYPSEYQNSEKKIAEMIRNKIAEISDFVPFLGADQENITDKVISVRAADCDARIAVTGNRIDLCGRDAEALAQAATTLMNLLSNAPVGNNVIDATVNGNAPLDERLKVTSFNVRFDLTENAGVSRVDAAVAQIRDLSPDVFGVQEDSQQWCQLLDQKLTEYTAVRYLLSAGNNEYLTIYYKTEMFTKVKSGLLWLSSTPNVPSSKFSESLNSRGMNYAILERKSDGAKFCFVNTHLENTTGSDSKVARQKQTQVLLEQTARIVEEYGDIPSIIVGDFNAVVNESIHSMIGESGYDNCGTVAFRITSRGTWNTGYYGDAVDKNSDTLDFCYASKNNFFICSYKVSADKYNNMYTSDHFPIIIELLLIK